MFDDLPTGGAPGGDTQGEPAADEATGTETTTDADKGAALYEEEAAKEADAEKGDDAADAEKTDDKSDDKADKEADKSEDDKDADKDADKDGEKDGDDKDDDKEDGDVPEKYEFTMPEGMDLDEAAAEAATPIFKELGLSNEQAQRLVDFYAGERAKLESANYEAWVKAQGEWQDATRADDEVGGKEFEEKLGIANKALSKYGTPELKDAMLATGAGNHVEFVRFAYRVGKAMSEDAIGSGPGQPDVPQNPAKVLFPDQN
jgi:hypothetical protein